MLINIVLTNMIVTSFFENISQIVRLNEARTYQRSEVIPFSEGSVDFDEKVVTLMGKKAKTPVRYHIMRILAQELEQ